jgi:hypothetical protein
MSPPFIYFFAQDRPSRASGAPRVGIARDQVYCEIIERVADLLRSMIGILLLPPHSLDINPITETEEFLQFRKLRRRPFMLRMDIFHQRSNKT